MKNSFGMEFKEPVTIFIDIETLPSPEPPSLDEIQAPANYKDEAKIQAFKESKINEFYRAQALDSMRGQLLCIGFAIDDGPVQTLIRGMDGVNSEYDLLEAFSQEIKYCSPVTWCGHNVKTFDLQWLWRKALKFGITALAQKIPRERYSRDVVDTLELWAGPDYRDRTSLDAIAQFLGLQGKTGDLDGSKVYDFWLEGKLQEIKDYCARDVELTRSIFNIINGQAEAPKADVHSEQPATTNVMKGDFEF